MARRAPVLLPLVPTALSQWLRAALLPKPAPVGRPLQSRVGLQLMPARVAQVPRFPVAPVPRPAPAALPQPFPVAWSALVRMVQWQWHPAAPLLKPAPVVPALPSRVDLRWTPVPVGQA